MNKEQLEALRAVLEYLKGAREDYESHLDALFDGNHFAGTCLKNHIWPSMAVLYDYLDSRGKSDREGEGETRA
jgi:hypothetical protein